MTRPLSPHFLITAALALVDVEATGDNEGDGISASLARRYRVPNGLADDAEADGTESAASAAATRMAEGWSAAFVHHVGYWSHFDHRLGASVWPLPATQSCAELAAFAASNFVLAADAPQPGDVYLLWSPARKSFVRAGIVLSVMRQFRYARRGTGYECLTVDGDTTCRGSLRGPRTAVVQRALSPARGDRLIRWPLLEITSDTQMWTAESPRRRAA